MEEKNVKKSLFVRLFEVVIRFILHFRIPILVLIILGTLFFTYALFSLQIDADVFSFAAIAPDAPYVTTPTSAPDGDAVHYTIPSDVELFVPDHYGYTERPESEKLHAAIPDYMRTGTKVGSYPDGFVVIFSSELLYTPEVLNLISDVMDEDVICPYGIDDRKAILADNFTCISDGEIMGTVSKEVIEKMPKAN